jgi:hypothetical protein
VKQGLLSTPTIIRYNFAQHQKPIVCFNAAKIYPWTRVTTHCLQSHERPPQLCLTRYRTLISGLPWCEVERHAPAQVIFWSLDPEARVSARVSFYRHICARVVHLLLFTESSQLKTWLSRLAQSSSRLPRKVQRQTGQHRIAISFSRPLGQKDVTGRQNLASCCTGSLLLYRVRRRAFASRQVPASWYSNVATFDSRWFCKAGGQSKFVVFPPDIHPLIPS